MTRGREWRKEEINNYSKKSLESSEPGLLLGKRARREENDWGKKWIK